VDLLHEALPGVRAPERALGESALLAPGESVLLAPGEPLSGEEPVPAPFAPSRTGFACCTALSMLTRSLACRSGVPPVLLLLLAVLRIPLKKAKVCPWLENGAREVISSTRGDWTGVADAGIVSRGAKIGVWTADVTGVIMVATALVGAEVAKLMDLTGAVPGVAKGAPCRDDACN